MDTAESFAKYWKETVTIALGIPAEKEDANQDTLGDSMPEWIVVDRDGKVRKARPEEIPKPIEHGCDLTDGTPVIIDSLKPEKRGDQDVHKKNKNVPNQEKALAKKKKNLR